MTFGNDIDPFITPTHTAMNLSVDDPDGLLSKK